jgi:predicted RNase H-like HicB family nuclease
MVNRYPLIIEWSDEDQEYIATCPAFPGLLAFGASEEEALKEAKIALKGFIATFEERGMALPEPTTRATFSGKLQLRLEKTLHRLAAQMAAAEGVSLNTFIVDAVQAKVSGVQVGNRILDEVRTAMGSKSFATIGKRRKVS